MKKEKENKCAFCERKTNYYFYELACYICPACLGEYKKNSAVSVYYDLFNPEEDLLTTRGNPFIW